MHDKLRSLLGQYIHYANQGDMATAFQMLTAYSEMLSGVDMKAVKEPELMAVLGDWGAALANFPMASLSYASVLHHFDGDALKLQSELGRDITQNLNQVQSQLSDGLKQFVESGGAHKPATLVDVDEVQAYLWDQANAALQARDFDHYDSALQNYLSLDYPEFVPLHNIVVCRMYCDQFKAKGFFETKVEHLTKANLYTETPHIKIQDSDPVRTEALIQDWRDVVERAYEERPHEFQKVLDIGAHIGRLTCPLRECLPDTVKVYALDPNPHALAMLQDRCQGVEAVQGSIEDLISGKVSLPERLNMVWVNSVLCILPEPTVEAFMAWLAVNADTVMIGDNLANMYADGLYLRIDRIGATPYFLHRFGTLLEKYGFTITDLKLLSKPTRPHSAILTARNTATRH